MNEVPSLLDELEVLLLQDWSHHDHEKINALFDRLNEMEMTDEEETRYRLLVSKF